ncbi:uncharacterized protein LOC111691494 [Anoplophora glabripennis]|uniref:uncharacterized protein LOC111691494 n=1 Tax=Anoplophora glabripennis TaxID=217634 RepID=UPI000C791930|nr:uncharacterized protein LOC111691494 [Anoplophora glabripennis]
MRRQCRIHFEIITDYNPQVRTYRDPKRTDWDSYRTELQARTREICTKLRNTYDLERAVEELQNAVTRSYEYSCPIKVRSDKHTVPWWSKELTQLRGQTRKLFNRAKRTGEWETYRATLTEYNKEIRKAKRDSWRKFCEDIDSVPQCAKLQRLLSKNGHTKLGSLKAPSGEYTKTGRETLELLLNTHFPGSRLLNHGDEYDWNHQQRVTTGSRQNWEVAKTVVSQSRIRWAISSFDPFKSPGADGILPVLLQQGVDCLAPVLIHVFRASIALDMDSRADFSALPKKVKITGTTYECIIHCTSDNSSLMTLSSTESCKLSCTFCEKEQKYKPGSRTHEEVQCVQLRSAETSCYRKWYGNGGTLMQEILFR